jgi:hypothetical protein
LEKPPGLGGGTAAKAGWKDLRSRWLGTFLALPERVPDVDEPNETDPDVTTASNVSECVSSVECQFINKVARRGDRDCDRAHTAHASTGQQTWQQRWRLRERERERWATFTLGLGVACGGGRGDGADLGLGRGRRRGLGERRVLGAGRA